MNADSHRQGSTRHLGTFGSPSDNVYGLGLRASQTRTRRGIASGTSTFGDRDDLTQEGVFACWRASPQFDPTRASLPTFFDRVAGNRISSVLRSTRTPVLVPLDAADGC